MSHSNIPNIRHVSFNAAGTMVTFPFEPYAIQREYIECVVKAASNKQNALLESPTGTGKTLSLLCSSLAWQQSSSAETVIYYTSRTHIQLSQAAKEMKKTAYSGVPAVVLASRTHMCLNDEVRQHQGHSINRACHNALAKNSCQYYQGYEQKMEASVNSNQVHDIEDLYNFGRQSQCCPYYVSKKFAETKASIVFMPYNYLLDLAVSKSTQLKLENSIVIFDEGHNLDSALKESASAHFNQSYLKEVEASCDKLPSKLSDVLSYERHGLTRYGYDPDKKRGSGIVDEFAKPKAKTAKQQEKEEKKNPIEELAEKLTCDKIRQVSRCADSLLSCLDLMKTKEGQYQDTKCSIEAIYNKLADAGVEFSTSDAIITTLDSMTSFWSIAGVMNPTIVARYHAAITNLSHFISLLYPQGCMSKLQKDNHVQKLKEYYAAYLEGTFEKGTVLLNSNKLTDWQLNLWCLHPAVGFKRVIDNLCIVGPRSIIVTSGTLAPMRPFENELETKFHIVREFKHLITKEQLDVMILGESPRKYSLISTYEEAKKPKYSEALGDTMLALFRMLPFGTLIFFPSYSLLNKVTRFWENQKPGLWREMSKAVRMFIESKEQSIFNVDFENFKKCIDSGGKAVFFGVCRGKLSEGTNLQANHCRSVIIVGLPFPSLHDPKVVETREFHSRRGDFKGMGWYTQQMRRALSQAFGRVIRSKNDFGMLFLGDPRFPQVKFSLSEWIRPFYPTDPRQDYAEICQDIKKFFSNHNVDLDAITFNESAFANSNNTVFEFDPKTKNRRRKQQAMNPVCNSITSSETEPLVGADKASKKNLYEESIKSPKSRQAAMIAGYTVDVETYNRVKSTRMVTSQSIEGAPAQKRPKTGDIFNSLYNKPAVNDDPQTVILNDTTDVSNQNSTSDRQSDVVTIDDSNNEPRIKPAKKPLPAVDRAAQQKCYICKNDAVRPHVINCPCARLGCYSCLKGLNNKNCGECGTVLKIKNFKQKLFNVFRKREA